MTFKEYIPNELVELKGKKIKIGKKIKGIIWKKKRNEWIGKSKEPKKKK